MAKLSPTQAPPDPGPAVQAPAALPDIGGAPKGPAPTQAPSGPPYYLQVHPDHWRVLGGHVVPRPRRLHLIPGANGVDRDTAGRPDPTIALSETARRGWTTIPWDVDGPGTSYLRPVGGGWLDTWTRTFPGSTAVRFDEAAFGRWLHALIQRGAIPGPELYALEALQDHLRSAAESAARAGLAARAAKCRDDLAVVEATLAAQVAA